MYDIEINGTSYPVKFGMHFISEINKRGNGTESISIND